MMAKNIILTLITLATVSLMVLGSITVNASPVSTTDYPYQLWNPNTQILSISKSEFKQRTSFRINNYANLSINNANIFINTTNFDYNGYYSQSIYTYNLCYVDGLGWSATQAIKYIDYVGYNDQLYDGYFVYIKPTRGNETEWNSITSNIPNNLPEAESLDSILNATTNTTNSAQNLQSSLSSSYNGYENGNVSASTLQSRINNTVSQLNTLSNNSSNTLADLMAVNNGLTYAQTVQDKLNADQINEHLEISTGVKNAITGYINQSNTAYNQYTNGTKSQSETIATLQNQLIYLNQIITNGTAKNSADIEAVNTAINTVQGIINNVSNYEDVDMDLSSEFESSEIAEKEFLEDQIAETTSQIQDMSAEQQFQGQAKTDSNNILVAIWDLEIFKRLIPICAVFMVVCVAIGVRYRL